jgi:hypothetical protein
MKDELEISQEEILENIQALEYEVELCKVLGQYHQRFHFENAIKRLRKMVIKHRWVLGVWVKDYGYSKRVDECSLCGCKRDMIKSYIKGKGVQQWVSCYERSGTSSPENNPPTCWGAKNP